MLRRHRYAVPAASKTAFRPSEEACPVSTTSGDPRNLNQFLEGSGPLRGGLTESARAAVKAVQAFAATGSVGGGSLGGLQAMIQLLADMGANEAFIHSITEALAAADRSGLGPVTLSDATLAARLKADGVGEAPSYLTVGASSLMGFPPTSGFVDDPVCALTGNFFHAEVDLSFPGRAALLDLARLLQLPGGVPGGGLRGRVVLRPRHGPGGGRRRGDHRGARAWPSSEVCRPTTTRP